MALENEGRHWKHGWRESPMLIGEDLVVEMKSIIGFDRETGAVKWKIPHKWKTYYHEGSKTVETSDQIDAVNYDGLGVYKPGLGFFPWSTATRDGRTLYRRGNVGRG